MVCQGCGRQNREGAAFCDGCGRSLAPSCSSCGAQLRPDSRFCDSCGTRTGSTGDVRAHTPEHLARKILQERERVEGERRNVTILFADAKGFTPLSEALDAEKVYEITQGCIRHMLEAVHRYEGTVNQFTGDGIMAIFGAPIAHEDPARRAVAAALEMQSSLERYSPDISFRVGLNSGPVVVGRISDDLEMDYTAIGDTVNLASRMEQMAEPGTVYLTDNTYRQVADYFECEDLGPLDVKGKASAVHAYRAVAERGVKTRLDAAVARGLSPFVGRDRDVEVLTGMWQEALTGRGQIVMISGEPGIGKSRLLLEFQRTLGEDVIWREAHCISYGEHIPYLPVIELVKNGFGITDTDDAGAIIDKIDADTTLWSPEAQKMAPYLKFLLQVDPGDAAIERMDPMERRAGILDALRALILERSKVAPRVVVIEDLHWADDQSEEAFRVCADAIVASNVLMILTFRPGYMHPSGDLPNAHRIVLGNLDADAQGRLATSTLEAVSLSPDLAEAVAGKAEGNPLFIEEVAKALAAGVSDAHTVPNTLQDVILARIDRLEREAREALQLASVIGREFTLRLLDRISDLEAELEGVLGGLKSLELIYEKTFFPELAYMFKHALTHDVAYSTLLLERRKGLHRIVAMAIEELYPDRLVEHHETLAHHYSLAEEWEKALDYLVKAGDKAVSSFASLEARRYYTQAIDVIETLGRTNTSQTAELLEKRGFAASSLGDLDSAIADFDTAARIGRQIGNRRMIITNLVNRGGWGEFFAHDLEKAVETLREALALCGPGDEDLRFAVVSMLFSAHVNFGELTAGRALLPQIEALRPYATPLYLGWHVMYEQAMSNWDGRYDASYEAADRYRTLGVGNKTVDLFVEWFSGVSLGGGGHYQQALDHLAEVLADTERVGDPFCQTRSLNTIGWIYGELQNLDKAIDWNTRCLEVASGASFPDPEIEANAKLNLADALIALGRLDEAEEELRWVERVIADPAPEERWALWIYSQHFFHTYGELCLIRGDLARAESYANECLALASETERSKNVVKARRLLGQIAQARGDVEIAGAQLAEALRVARDLGNPPQLWKTLAARGDYDEALAVIDGVAAGLADEATRNTFLASPHVTRIREAAVTPPAG